MPQGSFWDTPIGLKAFKGIFIFRPKMDFFPRGKAMHFSLVYVPRDLGKSKNCLHNPF